jgi:hypothetical protein
MKHSRLFWLCPLFVFVAVIAVILLVFIVPGTPAQGPTVLLFVTLCPGMSFVPLIRLRHFLIEATLSIALSLSIAAIVVTIFLYAQDWSPPVMLWVLIALSLLGSILQFLPVERFIDKIAQRTRHEDKQNVDSNDKLAEKEKEGSNSVEYTQWYEY